MIANQVNDANFVTNIVMEIKEYTLNNGHMVKDTKSRELLSLVLILIKNLDERYERKNKK